MDLPSFDQYRTLVEQGPMLVWQSDLTMGCNYFNQTWLAFTGRTLAQELGGGWVEGVHPEDIPRCMSVYTDAFAKRVVFEVEYRLRRFDGVYRWIFDRGVPYNSASGEFAGYIGGCIDITDRIEIKAQETELKVLQDLVPICAWCKKVRDDQGYWEQVEHYVSTRSALRFSHGMCPACYQKKFAESH